MRFGHTLLPGKVKEVDNNDNMYGFVHLSQVIIAPGVTKSGNIAPQCIKLGY